jgi:type III restriction enzyme
VLSLFFIDEVAKYRQYSDAGEEGGEYARIFEEEYREYLARPELPFSPAYAEYVKSIDVTKTHNGYFSIDKKTKRLVNPETGKKSTEADDVDAYDLILKDKKRLLSLEEPTRFIFSHSALREGWDNPNVFVICTLKHSDSTISRRQEVGRGLRLSVDKNGDRQDSPATVHNINVLTVVASESYTDFVSALQRDISESLSERPRHANEAFFTGRTIMVNGNSVEISPQMAKHIYKYLVKNDYIDDDESITEEYHEAKRNGALVPLPDDLQPFQEGVFSLIDSVYSDVDLLRLVEDSRKIKTNPLNANFKKKEFQALWNRINRKAAYTVHFNSDELIKKSINALNRDLRVNRMKYMIQEGQQKDSVGYDDIVEGNSFKVRSTVMEDSEKTVLSAVRYDIIGEIGQTVKLTRKTVAEIISGIEKAVFSQYKMNPEHFISEAARLIKEQKATVIIEHLTYDTLSETHDIDIFTNSDSKQDFSNAGAPLKHHIYDYVITDSMIERKFAEELDTSSGVVVYAKLPKGFFLPTPVGAYNPDWAIAFKEGAG